MWTIQSFRYCIFCSTNPASFICRGSCLNSGFPTCTRVCLCTHILSLLIPSFCSWSLKVVAEKVGSQLTVIAMILRGVGCLEEKDLQLRC